MQRPPLGLTTEAVWLGNRDGDTILVRLPILGECAIRLVDCWCEEMHTEAGRAAKAFLDSLFERGGQRVYVHLGAPEDRDHDGRITLLEILKAEASFDRLVGRVWIGDHDVSETMVAAGHATAQKETP